METLLEVVRDIPGLEEIASLLQDLIENSAEWAAAMIEMSTQTDVLKVLGATVLGTMMMIPPNFWTDMIGVGAGYLIPELLIAIVFAIIAYFTAGTGGTLLAARLTAFTAKVAAGLAKAGKAGKVLLRVFAILKALGGKMADLIKALKGKVDEVGEGVTNGTTRITRHIEPAKMKEGVDRHMRERDLSVPRKRGIGGAHNKTAFDQALKDENAKVLSRTPDPDVPGVEHVEYQLPSLDPSAPPGTYKSQVYQKTIYDPKVISDQKWMQWGQEAADDAIRRNSGVLPEGGWSGKTRDGIQFFGHSDRATGEVTSFWIDR